MPGRGPLEVPTQRQALFRSTGTIKNENSLGVLAN